MPEIMLLAETDVRPADAEEPVVVEQDQVEAAVRPVEDVEPVVVGQDQGEAAEAVPVQHPKKRRRWRFPRFKRQRKGGLGGQ